MSESRILQAPFPADSPEGIDYDLEGTRRYNERVWFLSSRSQPPTAPGRVRSLRDLDVRPTQSARAPIASETTPLPGTQFAGRGGSHLPGGELVTRRPMELRNRYQTLFYVENQFPQNAEHAYLIAPACVLLEAELDVLLVQPCRAIANELVTALRQNGEAKPAEILDDWACGRKPTTIGTVSMIFLALRRGYEQGRGAILGFLRDHFQAGYTIPLLDKRLGSWLDHIRNQYRNPACHGTGTFGRAEYEQFVGLMVAHRRFMGWQREGPAYPLSASPGASPLPGLLHWHLQQSLLLEPEPTLVDPLGKLLALTQPRESQLIIELQPFLAHNIQGQDNLSGNQATRLARSLRLGDAVRFGFRANRPCRVTLINIGTTGNVNVVLPNAWRGNAEVQGDRLYFLPGPDFPEFEYVLGGHPGQEQMIALASLDPIPVPLLPDEGKPFRKLSYPEIDNLVNTFQTTVPDRWAACACAFAVESGG